MNLEELLDELIRREGGYVNDPDDPGGATNFGITIGTLSQHLGRRATVADVRALTVDQAKKIYISRYLVATKIDKLPAEILPTVFDMYVNAGSNAIKILQDTLNQFGENLQIDGGLGPKTISSCLAVHKDAGSYLVDAYGIERRNYYYRLADRRPSSRKYARTKNGGKGGWIKRAEEFISKRFWLTDIEHKNRTKTWG